VLPRRAHRSPTVVNQLGVELVEPVPCWGKCFAVGVVVVRVQDTTGVIAHSDTGVQYLAVRYTQRLADAGAVASVGSASDYCDNALAEAFNSLFAMRRLWCRPGAPLAWVTAHGGAVATVAPWWSPNMSGLNRGAGFDFAVSSE
jgi:transposase InsO family protein